MSSAVLFTSSFVPFSSLQLSILHSSCRRVCGGGWRFQDVNDFRKKLNPQFKASHIDGSFQLGAVGGGAPTSAQLLHSERHRLEGHAVAMGQTGPAHPSGRRPFLHLRGRPDGVYGARGLDVIREPNHHQWKFVLAKNILAIR